MIAEVLDDHASDDLVLALSEFPLDDAPARVDPTLECRQFDEIFAHCLASSARGVENLSVWTEDVFTFDNLLHSSGGAFMAAIIGIGFWYPWSLTISVPIIFSAWGYVREVAQSENDWSSPLDRPHKLWEAAAWGVGAWVATTALFLIWRFA